ncbi:hypothetical protein AGMMS49942_30180 [Spirochaetia bacterium]|nr:hypothetical protein AGMMS49942_30180 [Spirochaetia bacterium]
MDGRADGLIHRVNLSFYPSPCQCKCIYCWHSSHGELKLKGSTAEKIGYEKVLDTIDYAQKNGILAKDVSFVVSFGEITIHPYKDRIFNLIKNNTAIFFTNCFIFSEQIAQNLASNPHSEINLSIDSGTAQTWFKVKGVDNFEKIKNNLIEYQAACLRPEQIQLKYIVLPGINDSCEDYSSLIELMKVLELSHLELSRDNIGIKYDIVQQNVVVEASASLAAMLIKNKMTYSFFAPFTPTEQRQITECANEFSQADRVLSSQQRR